MNQRNMFSPKQKRLFIALTAALMLPGVVWGQPVTDEGGLRNALTGASQDVDIEGTIYISSPVIYNPAAPALPSYSLRGTPTGLNGSFKPTAPIDHFFIISSSGTLNFEKLDFTSVSGLLTGSAILANGVFNGKIESVKFQGVATSLITGDGGAIRVDGVGSFAGEIINSEFTDYSVRGEGGAIYLDGEIRNGIHEIKFINNSAAGNGGAIRAGSLSGGITGGRFTDNQTSGGSGGAIYVNGDFSGGINGSQTSNVLFNENQAGIEGGAIYVGEKFNGSITGTTFTNNKATTGRGGALYVANKSGAVGSTAFSGNIENSSFSGSQDGGAVYINGTLDGNISETNFTDNHDLTAGAEGGALYVKGDLTGGIAGKVSSRNSIQNNGAAGNGGAVFIGGDLSNTVSYTDFSNNESVSGSGGAIAVMGTMNADLSGSVFRGNKAGTSGGALYLAQGGRLTATTGNVTFSGNMANGAPNAIDFNTGDLSLEVEGSYTMDFEDPISNSIAPGVTPTISINPNTNNTGTVRFAQHQSNIVYQKASINYGTLVLDDHVNFGANNNDGTFTQGADAIISINPGMTLAANESIHLNAGTLVLGGRLDFVGNNPDAPLNSVAGTTILESTAKKMVLNSPTVSLALPGNATLLNGGEHIVLIGTNNADVSGTTSNKEVNVVFGSAITAELDVLTENGNLIARMPYSSSGGSSQSPGGPSGSYTPIPGTQIYSQGYAAGLATLTGGADLVNDLGMDRALDAARLRPGLQAFGVLSGGKQRFLTGSHISLTGYNVMAGVAYQQEMGFSALTFGGYLEYGLSHYRTTEFITGTRYEGDGRADYVGGGLLGRWDFGEEGSHFYLEGLVRAGRVKVDFNTNDVNNQRSEYETAGNYYGANVGGGYLWVFDEKNSVNAYGKLMWVNQADEDTTLTTGNPLDFDAVNSIRARIGARYQYEFETKGPHVYVGLAYQHELDGKIKVVANNAVPLEEAEMKGGAAMAELGLVFADMFEKPLTFEFALQGYAGKREGVLGSFRVNYLF